MVEHRAAERARRRGRRRAAAPRRRHERDRRADPGRMGLYFIDAGRRDRGPSRCSTTARGSAFALAEPGAIDWRDACCVARLGYTCRALPPRSASAPRRRTNAPPTQRPRSASPCRSTATTASSCGPRRAATRRDSCARCWPPRVIAFVDDRDVAPDTRHARFAAEDAVERRRAAAAAAFAAFPTLERICSTMRTSRQRHAITISRA